MIRLLSFSWFSDFEVDISENQEKNTRAPTNKRFCGKWKWRL